MRLLCVNTLKLCQFDEAKTPRPYAIASHRWGDSEATLEDVQNRQNMDSAGYKKLEAFAEYIREYVPTVRWLWIDTCCIDKKSSSELVESINSMFTWYRHAERCYVYLHDVVKRTASKPFRKSEWFKRGWTLQELLAPSLVVFLDSNWNYLGTKEMLAAEIAEATGIHRKALAAEDLQGYSVGQKMSWAACRKTTRPEDLAYCLLGIFDVNLVPIYGEGAEKAFIRLQRKIIKHEYDHSIFAWSMNQAVGDFSGLLAPSPQCFRDCSATGIVTSTRRREPFSVTNRGLSIYLEITPYAVDTYLAFIDSEQCGFRLAVFLRRLSADDQYARINFDGRGGVFADKNRIYGEDCYGESASRPIRKVHLFVPNSHDLRRAEIGSIRRVNGFRVPRHYLSCDLPEHNGYLELERPWHLRIVDLQPNTGFSQAALGFDFDFNPVCLLTEVGAKVHLRSLVPTEKETAEGFEYMDITEGSRVFPELNKISDSHGQYEGLWRLKGHRSFGLDVGLMYSFNPADPAIITLSRTEGESLSWELGINPSVSVPAAAGSAMSL